MKRYVTVMIVFLALIALQVPAFAGSVPLAWEAPTTNEDGTPLTDLGGYTVYWADLAGGSPLGNLDVGNVTTTTITLALENTTIYFRVTAYDTSGNESAPSNEVSYLFPPMPPASPANLRVGS